VSIVQDLPISKPFVPSEIDRVAQAKAVTAYAPLYLDLLSAGPRLQGVIERIKSIGAVLKLATCNVRGFGVWGVAHASCGCVVEARPPHTTRPSTPPPNPHTYPTHLPTEW